MRLLLASLALAVTACGSATVPPGSGEAGEPARREPPPVVLHLAAGDEPLEIWTTCWQTEGSAYCADGGPPQHPVDVGSPDRVAFGFDEPGWTFAATFREVGMRCHRSLEGEVVASGDRNYVVEPAGPAGTWDVDLFGRGPQGDVSATFRWTTPRLGSVPNVATGLATVLADHDGRLDSYGVGLTLTDLDRTPDRASGSLVVTSADGVASLVELRRDDGCHGAGTVVFSAPTHRGVDIAERVGRAPFTYEAHLELDGRTHVGTATWPAGQVPGREPSVVLTWEPSVVLTWEPPLPAYDGR